MAHIWLVKPKCRKRGMLCSFIIFINCHFPCFLISFEVREGSCIFLKTKIESSNNNNSGSYRSSGNTEVAKQKLNELCQSKQSRNTSACVC